MEYSGTTHKPKRGMHGGARSVETRRSDRGLGEPCLPRSLSRTRSGRQREEAAHIFLSWGEPPT
jgi:hypothetical protein